MTEEKYDARTFALELGFSEADAEFYAQVNPNATNLRNVAKAKRAKGLMPDQLAEGVVIHQVKGTSEAGGILPYGVKPNAKKHHHSYRKDGTCACGAVKGVKLTAEEKEKKAEAEAAQARAEVEAEAAERPTYGGQGSPPAD